MGTAKTLIRLGGCPGWSDPSLGAQSLCWFCHVAAHLPVYIHHITGLESKRPEIAKEIHHSEKSAIHFGHCYRARSWTKQQGWRSSCGFNGKSWSTSLMNAGGTRDHQKQCWIWRPADDRRYQWNTPSWTTELGSKNLLRSNALVSCMEEMGKPFL